MPDVPSSAGVTDLPPSSSEAYVELVTPQPQAEVEDLGDAIAGGRVISREEKIEYRDEAGRLLNEDEVAALEGKVSFQTKYETRTRLVDEAGNEIQRGRDGGEPEMIAPAHPDVNYQETSGENDVNSTPLDAMIASANDDVAKEQSLVEEDKSRGMPRPGSERDEATAATT